ncbi:hypothetical protein HPB47_010388 [Ixodes persulcatus]|uniref:Uncharacterized protein n=1 Tax=Ixodes persulcatus TaxID=34615 RepID=A0AC60NZ78_IXOPE|nr:hypothetical protein HPB47_010388 [Ixodes persulcatus]
MHLGAFVILLKAPTWAQTQTVDLKRDSNSDDPNFEVEEGKTECPVTKNLDSHEEQKSAPSIFRTPSFYVILASGVTGFYTQNIFFSTIVDFTVDKGFVESDAASLMTYFAVSEIVGRLGLPLLADHGYIRRTTLMTWNFFFMGLSMLLFSQFTAFAWVQASCVLFAAFFGSAVTIEGVLIADYLGVPRLSLCFGLIGILSVPLFLSNPLVLEGGSEDEDTASKTRPKSKSRNLQTKDTLEVEATKETPYEEGPGETEVEGWKRRKQEKDALADECRDKRLDSEEVALETTNTTKRSKSRRRKKWNILGSDIGETGNDEAADLQEKNNDREIRNDVDEKSKRQTKTKGNESVGNGEALEIKEDAGKSKSKKAKKVAGMIIDRPDEETENPPAKKRDQRDSVEKTDSPKNEVASIAEKPTIKLQEHSNKASPIVKVKEPRTNSDQAGRLGQWIVGSSEASKPVERQSKENGDLMTSQLRNLLLREHKESNWAQDPSLRKLGLDGQSMETSQRHGTEETNCSAKKQRLQRRQSRASGVDTCWHIAAVAFLAQMLLAISDRNSGFLYVGYMDMFSIERKQASWPQTIAFMVGCPAARGKRKTFDNTFVPRDLRACPCIKSVPKGNEHVFEAGDS